MKYRAVFLLLIAVICCIATSTIQAFPCSPVLMYVYTRCKQLGYKISPLVHGHEISVTITTTHANLNNTSTEHDLLIYSTDSNKLSMKLVTTTSSNENIILDQQLVISINYEHPALAIPTESSCVITKYLTAQEIANKLVDFFFNKKNKGSTLKKESP